MTSPIVVDTDVFPSGLKLRLFVEQFEYIESLSDAAGVRVVVHNQSMMPFPEDDGFSVSPGTKTTVGIRKVCFSY